MKYLVSGGSGYVGRALCRTLSDDGHDVTVWTRDALRAKTVLPPGVLVVEQLAHAPRVDVVVNLAGENLAAQRWSDARKQALLESRLHTTQALVDWLAAQRVRPAALISASAVGWYGPRGDEVLDEESAGGNDFAARLCAAWEWEAMRGARYIARVCCLRIGIVVSRDGGAVARMIPPLRFGIGSRFGNGRQWTSWIARSDLVRMIGWLAHHERAHGVYNATAPTPVTNSDFSRAVALALHRRAAIPVPAFALRAALGEMADLLLNGQRVLPRRALREGFEFVYTDPVRALAYSKPPSLAAA